MRLRTMHKRRKRKLSNKHRQTFAISALGCRLKLTKTGRTSPKLETVWIGSKLLPKSKIKGFELTFNNSLPIEENPLETCRGYLEPSPQVSLEFKVDEKFMEQFFSVFGVRHHTEDNGDGTFSHTLICDTKDYDIFNSEIIE